MSDKRPTPGLAFKLYKGMGDVRTVNGLHALLKAKHYTIGRNTVSAWAKEHRWDERIDRREGLAKDPDVAVAAAELERFTSEDLKGVQTIEDVLGVCLQMVVGLAKTTIATIASVEIQDVDDASRLSKATTDAATALANIKKTLSEAGAAIPADPVGAGRAPFVAPVAEKIAAARAAVAAAKA